MTKVRLTSNNAKLTTRTRVIEGETKNLPELGKPFIMFGPGLVAGIRAVETSPLTTLAHTTDMKDFTFETASGSSYRLEVLDG